MEIVRKKGRIGAYLDKDLELLEKDTVRPVFKCRVSDRHKHSLGIDYVWVDAEQLVADGQNYNHVMAYATKEATMMEHGDVKVLASLLDAINTVSGAEGEKGEDKEAAEENKNPEGSGVNTSTQPQTITTPSLNLQQQ